MNDITELLVQDLRGLIRDVSVPLRGGPCVDTMLRLRALPDRMREMIPYADEIERGVLAFYALTVTEILDSLGGGQQWHNEVAWFVRELVHIAHELLEKHDARHDLKREMRTENVQAQNDNRRAQFVLSRPTAAPTMMHA